MCSTGSCPEMTEDELEEVDGSGGETMAARSLAICEMTAAEWAGRFDG